MNGISRHVRALILASMLWTPQLAAAQASADLPAGSRIEWAVEKLVGFGLIDDRIAEIRPWSQREARRLIREAQSNLSRLDNADRAAAERILAKVTEDRLNDRFGMSVRADATALDSPWTPIPSETGADRIDAEVNHLVPYPEGRDIVDGRTIGVEADVTATLNDHVALQALPRVWLADASSGSADTDARLLEAQARFQYRNVRLDIGRSVSMWGPGEHGGTLLTDNAHGLDRIRISNDAPFRWPGFMSWLGPTKVELFAARLEANRDIPHNILVGYTISARPHKYVEGTLSALVQSGGDGGPDASFGRRLADHLLFIDWILNNGSSYVFSNKAAMSALRFRIPSLRNAQLYLEWIIEDPSINLERLYWQDAAWLAGMWVPRLSRDAKWDLRAEYHHGGVRLHRHAQFTSGRTLDRRIIGMGGPDTDAGFVEVAMDNRRLRILFHLGFENRSADTWRARLTEDGSIDVWKKVEDLPDELSLIGLGSVRFFDVGGREFSLGIGAAHVWNSLFTKGDTRFDGILQIKAVLPLPAAPIVSSRP